MGQDLGVLILHGMGNQPEDFAGGLIDELSGRIADASRIAFHPVWWAPVIQPREDALWRAMKDGGTLGWDDLRQFVLSNLGDAVAYQQTPGRTNTTYARIHERLRDEIRALRARLGDRDQPLVVLAHSLGGAIASSYAWDRQQGRGPKLQADTALERMETLAGIVTFGCNIPLFTLAYQKVESIEFPPPALAQRFPRLVPAARWLNFYDPQDVLGWPLRPLGRFNTDPESKRRYDLVVHSDTAINVGGLLTSWNPLSHNEYWTDNDFTKPVARLIEDLLRLV